MAGLIGKANELVLKLYFIFALVHCLSRYRNLVVQLYLKYYKIGFCCLLVEFRLIHKVVHDRKNAIFPRPYQISS